MSDSAGYGAVGAVNERERERLEAVLRQDILDTPPDGAFDRITALAADYFDVPVSIVSIVDRDRIWFKSKFGLDHLGLDVEEVGRDPGLCASAILQDEVFVIEDAAADPGALANPLVAGEAGFRFYAGAPLETADGHNLGTLCILDREPRVLSAEQQAHLQDLAAIVVNELELRMTARRLAALDAKERAVSATQAAVFVRSLNPMVIVDDEHLIEDANCAAGLLCRVPRETLRGLRLEDLLLPERKADVDLLFEELSSRGAASARSTFLLPDQTLLEIECSATENIQPGRHLLLLTPFNEEDDGDAGRSLASDDPGATAADTTEKPVLTKREREVLGLLAMGDTGEQIAAQLFISPETVRTHVQNAREKLGASTRSHAIALALGAGEISFELLPAGE